MTLSRWLDPILRPLARLAIHRGWLFPQVSERLRQSFLNAALDEAGADCTDSKLSIMTGLQRRDVARLRTASAPPVRPERQPLAEIISLWATSPDHPETGLPVQGDSPSFAALAAQVQKDVHPRTFLDILKENGAVSEVDGTVTLHVRSFQPLAGTEAQLDYLAGNVGDHLGAAVGNVVSDDDRYDVSVHYSGLSTEAVARIEARWREEQHRIAQEIDELARSLPSSESGTARFRAGAYFFDEGPET